MPLRPVILVTVFRRYHELSRNLEKTWELSGEFAVPPIVVVVWAAPEPGRMWFFRDLMAKGLVQHVIPRPLLMGDGNAANTTYPESVNLRLGLEFIRKNYEDAYVLMQAADISPNPGCYRFVERFMQDGETRAMVFHWPNNLVVNGIWHTNFFCVPANDDRYWPPVSTRDHADVLEWQWGKRLTDLQLPGLMQTSNYNQKFFNHAHESESLPVWPIIPQLHVTGVCLSVRGYKSLRQKLRDLWSWCMSRLRRFKHGKD